MITVTENLSVKAEYLYTDLGTRSDGAALEATGITTAAFSPELHSASVGLNRSFLRQQENSGATAGG